MIISEADAARILRDMLEECSDIEPPLYHNEIVNLFIERITLDATEIVNRAMRRLVADGTVEVEGKSYRLQFDDTLV